MYDKNPSHATFPCRWFKVVCDFLIPSECHYSPNKFLSKQDPSVWMYLLQIAIRKVLSHHQGRGIGALVSGLYSHHKLECDGVCLPHAWCMKVNGQYFRCAKSKMQSKSWLPLTMNRSCRVRKVIQPAGTDSHTTCLQMFGGHHRVLLPC